jgi:hypothetical protein
MSAPTIEPDAEQLEELQARRLLELAGGYVRLALQVPDDLDNLRTIVAEMLLENAMLRLDLRRLAGRVDALEKRAGVGR